MEYSTNLKEVLMRSNHKFIYGESLEREKYLKALAKEFPFQSAEVKPVGIYIKDSGLEECHNKNCDYIAVSSFNSRYFEMVVAYEIINKLMNEMPPNELEKIGNELLSFFNINTMNGKFKSLEELRQELLKTKEIYMEEYHHYIITGEAHDFLNRLRIMMVMLDFMIIKLKFYIPTIKRINLFIDKDSDYSAIYTRVINFYINARSNCDLSINVGCENFQDWVSFRDINGNIIQAMHDYQDVDMRDFALVRKKEME